MEMGFRSDWTQIRRRKRSKREASSYTGIPVHLDKSICIFLFALVHNLSDRIRSAQVLLLFALRFVWLLDLFLRGEYLNNIPDVSRSYLMT